MALTALPRYALAPRLRFPALPSIVFPVAYPQRREGRACQAFRIWVVGDMEGWKQGAVLMDAPLCPLAFCKFGLTLNKCSGNERRKPGFESAWGAYDASNLD